MRCWRRAAKAGCLEGLLRYGTALYRGSDGVPQDAQDAHIMLSRALRCALALPDSGSRQAVGAASPLEQVAPPSQAAQAARDAPAAQAAPSAAAPPAAAVVVLTGVHDVEELRIRVVRRAGLLLGYLAHDGEGVRQDACEAVRCFQLAAEAGCGEAAAALGWSWNTGQY
jgi:TPR repeat protein